MKAPLEEKRERPFMRRQNVILIETLAKT